MKAVMFLWVAFHYIVVWIIWCGIQSAAGWEMMTFGQYSALYWTSTAFSVAMITAVAWLRGNDS